MDWWGERATPGRKLSLWTSAIDRLPLDWKQPDPSVSPWVSTICRLEGEKRWPHQEASTFWKPVAYKGHYETGNSQALAPSGVQTGKQEVTIPPTHTMSYWLTWRNTSCDAIYQAEMQLDACGVLVFHWYCRSMAIVLIIGSEDSGKHYDI